MQTYVLSDKFWMTVEENSAYTKNHAWYFDTYEDVWNATNFLNYIDRDRPPYAMTHGRIFKIVGACHPEENIVVPLNGQPCYNFETRYEFKKWCKFNGYRIKVLGESPLK